MQMIVMTSAQAAGVRGPTSPGNALAPVALADGATFVLPVDVLTDPAHEVRHALLATFTQRDVSADEFPKPNLP